MSPIRAVYCSPIPESHKGYISHRIKRQFYTPYGGYGGYGGYPGGMYPGGGFGNSWGSGVGISADLLSLLLTPSPAMRTTVFISLICLLFVAVYCSSIPESHKGYISHRIKRQFYTPYGGYGGYGGYPGGMYPGGGFGNSWGSGVGISAGIGLGGANGLLFG
ncbi:hypothetical protein OESDEN_05735 [Oesophagostomum dentatum]|uniref:Uncharacterized protein n=1 Tax=Oesophagostomum dentatum TaxID=61180 RepID=A0A0B1TFZ4_OESDE|nr:hypothetical protein OESDEN_05735 [Oesophagostomum dentatum]